MSTLPKRHQRSIIPQQRDTQGKFKQKVPARRNTRGIYPPQAIPTMLVANNGVIGEK